MMKIIKKIKRLLFLKLTLQKKIEQEVADDPLLKLRERKRKQLEEDKKKEIDERLSRFSQNYDNKATTSNNKRDVITFYIAELIDRRNTVGKA